MLLYLTIIAGYIYLDMTLHFLHNQEISCLPQGLESRTKLAAVLAKATLSPCPFSSIHLSMWLSIRVCLHTANPTVDSLGAFYE